MEFEILESVATLLEHFYTEMYPVLKRILVYYSVLQRISRVLGRIKRIGVMGRITT